jgi:hypothetical protein
MRGGAGAAETTLGKVGTVENQFQQTFGPNPVSPYGNEVVINGRAPGMPGMPTPNNLALAQSGGRRRRGKRGGFLGDVVSRAVVPFALWGLQNKYATRRRRR